MITKDQIRSEFPFTKNSAMSFDNGWNQLVYDLCEEIDCLLDSEYMRETFIVEDIKEKYGGLRYYVSGATNLIYDTIDRYEALSYNTCEVCGKQGKLRDYGWMRTLCDEHYTDDLKKYDRKIEE